MNNKGFTLIELLATVVILGLVMGIGVYGVTSTINKSKTRGEAMFVEKLSDAINEYIDYHGSSFSGSGSEYSFKKCVDVNCANYYNVTAKEVKKDGARIKISDLISEGLIDKAKAVNPANDKRCFDSANPEIIIFKDSDYVYYYYVDLSGNNTNCEISDENAIINTLVDKLYNAIGDIE